MAYDFYAQATCSNRTTHRVEFYCRRNAVSGNSSNYWWQIGLRRTSSWQGTWTGSSEPWSVYVGSTIHGSSSYPFSSSVSWITAGSGTSGWIGHNSAGNMQMWVDGQQHGSFFGYAMAGGTFYTDRIPKPPEAPTPVSGTPDQIETTSMRFQFNGNDNGGASLLRWEVQYSTSPTFASGNSALITSSGTTVVTGLNPATTYYFRARGVNTVGAGAWSAARSGKTKSGVYVGSQSSFQGAQVMIGKSGAYVETEIMVGKGGSFVPAG